MNSMPHELAWGDVLLSPTIPVFTLALLGAWITGIVLNKLRIGRYIMYPSATFLALMAAYVVLMNTFWIRI